MGGVFIMVGMKTIAESSKELGICYNTMRKYVIMGLVKHIRLGRSYLISEDELSRIKKEGIRLPSQED